MKWKEIKVYPDTLMYQTVLNVLKHPKSQHPSKSISFTPKGSKSQYKLEFEWQDESICGVTVLKGIEHNESNLPSAKMSKV